MQSYVYTNDDANHDFDLLLHFKYREVIESSEMSNPICIANTSSKGNCDTLATPVQRRKMIMLEMQMHQSKANIA